MANQVKINDSSFAVGDTVKVHYKIIEKEKKAGTTKRSVTEEIKHRVQPFEGIIIAVKGSPEGRTFTVRKLASDGIGVERIFPANSPWIKEITLVKKGRVRRAKLYYLRASKSSDIKKLSSKR